jgi:hypothetical protein
MVLEREEATYRAKLPELLEKYGGRYVLIHGDDVIGTYETPEQALEVGYERWLFEPFMIKQIVAVDKPRRIG